MDSLKKQGLAEYVYEPFLSSLILRRLLDGNSMLKPGSGDKLKL
jgi:hypothetical protein